LPSVHTPVVSTAVGTKSTKPTPGAPQGDDKWSLRLTLEQPALFPAEAQKELGTVAFSEAEARLLASDVFVTSELQLPDTVRTLDFALDLSDPRLMAIGL
jgi:hypothetical protein